MKKLILLASVFLMSIVSVFADYSAEWNITDFGKLTIDIFGKVGVSIYQLATVFILVFIVVYALKKRK